MSFRRLDFFPFGRRLLFGDESIDLWRREASDLEREVLCLQLDQIKLQRVEVPDPGLGGPVEGNLQGLELGVAQMVHDQAGDFRKPHASSGLPADVAVDDVVLLVDEQRDHEAELLHGHRHPRDLAFIGLTHHPLGELQILGPFQDLGDVGQQVVSRRRRGGLDTRDGLALRATSAVLGADRLIDLVTSTVSVDVHGHE